MVLILIFLMNKLKKLVMILSEEICYLLIIYLVEDLFHLNIALDGNKLNKIFYFTKYNFFF